MKNRVAATCSVAPGRALDNSLPIEHVYEPDREAMLAALRVVLGLPKVLPSRNPSRER